jgi:hypothetical protein
MDKMDTGILEKIIYNIEYKKGDEGCFGPYKTRVFF